MSTIDPALLRNIMLPIFKEIFISTTAGTDDGDDELVAESTVAQIVAKSMVESIFR